MWELHGTSLHPGVAIAVAVVVDVAGGVSGIPETVLNQGLKALRSGFPEVDWPEVVVMCDQVAVGASVRLPGIRTVGIAAEHGSESGVPLNVPCVSDVCDLLKSITDEQIVIVDGDEGTVIITPDARTVVRYQERINPSNTTRVFLESAHIPARTQDGRIVLVAALVSSIAEAESAVSQGADRLIVRFSKLIEQESTEKMVEFIDPEVEMLETLLALAPGKPIVLIADPEERLYDVANRYGLSGQVSFQNAVEEPEALSTEQVRAAVLSGVEDLVVAVVDVTKTKNLIRTLPEDPDYARES